MRALVTVGLPACGKSTFARTLAGFVEINRDALRQQLTGRQEDHRREGAVSRAHAQALARAAAAGQDVIISDTQTRRGERRRLIRALRALGYHVEVVVFDVDEATCLERNHHREPAVPPAVVARMAQRLRAHPPTAEEGMDELRVLRQEGVPPLFP